jgi:putative transposase
MLKDIASKNGDARAKQEAIAHLRREFEVSERRACTVGVDRTSVRYRSPRANDDAIRVRLHQQF